MQAQDKGNGRGIVTKVSPYGTVTKTLERLQKTVRGKGIDVLALIDHGGAAERVGLQMQEAELLIFGNPRSGTPLMVASPLLALDLPLKVLVWRGDDDKILVSYNATSYLVRRHGIPENLAGNIAGIDSLVRTALGEA